MDINKCYDVVVKYDYSSPQEKEIPWKRKTLKFLKEIKSSIDRESSINTNSLEKLRVILDSMWEEVASRKKKTSLSCGIGGNHRNEVKRKIRMLGDRVRVLLSKKEKLKEALELSSLPVTFVDSDGSFLSTESMEKQIDRDCSREGYFYIKNRDGSLEQMPNDPETIKTIVKERLRNSALLREEDKNEENLNDCALKLIYLSTQNTGNSVFHEILRNSGLMLLNPDHGPEVFFEITDEKIKTNVNLKFTKVTNAHEMNDFVLINLHACCKCDYVRDEIFDISSPAEVHTRMI